MGENNMKVNEISDYLSEKKNDVKNYILDKKENIKDGAKKAISTGLVVSTLLTGAIATTGCEQLPDDLSQASYEQVVNGINKELSGFLGVNKIDYSSINISLDPVSKKYLIMFIDENKGKDVTFEISKENYETIKSLSLLIDDNTLTKGEQLLKIPKETLENNNELKDIVDNIYINIKNNKSTSYDAITWYELYTGSEYYGDEDVDYIVDAQLKDHEINDFNIDEIELLQWGPVPDGISIGDINYEIDDYFGVSSGDGSLLIQKPHRCLKFVDYYDSDGDGIDDRKKCTFWGMGNSELSNALWTLLNDYVDGESIRYDDYEENEIGKLTDTKKIIFKKEVLGNNDYYTINKILKPIVCRIGYFSGQDIDEPIQQEQSMEK